MEICRTYNHFILFIMFPGLYALVIYPSPSCMPSVEEIFYVSKRHDSFFILIKEVNFALLSSENMNQGDHFFVWLDVNWQQLKLKWFLGICMFLLEVAFDLWLLLMDEGTVLQSAVWLLLLMYIAVSVCNRCPILFEIFE